MTKKEIKSDVGCTPAQARIKSEMTFKFPDGEEMNGFLVANPCKHLEVEVYATMAVDHATFLLDRTTPQPIEAAAGEAALQAISEFKLRDKTIASFLQGKVGSLPELRDRAKRLGKNADTTPRKNQDDDVVQSGSEDSECSGSGDECDRDVRASPSAVPRSKVDVAAAKPTSDVVNDCEECGADGGESDVDVGGTDDATAPWPNAMIEVTYPDGITSSFSLGHKPRPADPDECDSRSQSSLATVRTGNRKLTTKTKTEAVPPQYWLSKLDLHGIMLANGMDQRDINFAARCVERETKNKNTAADTLKRHLVNVNHAHKLQVNSLLRPIDDGDMATALHAMRRAEVPLPLSTLVGIVIRHGRSLRCALLTSMSESQASEFWSLYMPFHDPTQALSFDVKNPRFSVLTLPLSKKQRRSIVVDEVLTSTLSELILAAGDPKNQKALQVFCSCGLPTLDLPEDFDIPDDIVRLSLDIRTILLAVIAIVNPTISVQGNFEGFNAIEQLSKPINLNDTENALHIVGNKITQQPALAEVMDNVVSKITDLLQYGSRLQASANRIIEIQQHDFDERDSRLNEAMSQVLKYEVCLPPGCCDEVNAHIKFSLHRHLQITLERGCFNVR